MKKTVKYTSEKVYNNFKLDNTRKVVENSLREYQQKHGASYRRIVKVISVAEFLDKIRNEMRNVTIEGSNNIIGELNRIMQSSKGLIRLIKKIELKNYNKRSRL